MEAVHDPKEPKKRFEETAARTLPVHAALLRPIQIGGADRELALANGVVCVALIFGIGISKYTLGVVALLLTIGHWGLVRVCRYDPFFRLIYIRHVQLRDYYVAAPAPHARRPVVHAAVPYSG